MPINICDYMPYLMNPRFDVRDDSVRKKHNNEKKLVSNIDTLFFNFLNILKHKSIYEFYDKNVEKKIKLEMVQKYENVKYKQKDAVVQQICYEDDITLEGIAYLAFCEKLNFCYLNHNVYTILNNHDSSRPFFVVKKNKMIQIYNTQKMEALYESDTFCIENHRKPMYAISHYKVDDLKALCSTLGLDYDSDSCKKKNYENILTYINLNLL